MARIVSINGVDLSNHQPPIQMSASLRFAALLRFNQQVVSAVREHAAFSTGTYWDRKRRSYRLEHRRADRRRMKAARARLNVSTSQDSLAITKHVYDRIRETVGALRAECGGALGGSYDDWIVTDFAFDESASKTQVTYSPDTSFLNRLFKHDWNPRGIRLLSFVHSHPAGAKFVSQGDRVYAAQILDAIPDLDRLYLPIVMSEADGVHFEIIPFVARRDGRGGVRIDRASLAIV